MPILHLDGYGPPEGGHYKSRVQSSFVVPTSRWAVRGAVLEADGERIMCQRVQCERCGKASWVGCGQHVEEVLKGVPQSQRCQCERPKSFLDKLFGK